MNGILVSKLVRIGFSEREAKAYLALLSSGPVSGYGLARRAGIPRSAIHQVADQLAGRGAVVTLPTGNTTKYAPVPVVEFLDRLQREHAELIDSLKTELAPCAPAPNLNHVWNIQGEASILARAQSMIGQGRSQILLAILPASFPAVHRALEDAIRRGVQVVLYTTRHVDLPGGRVVISPAPEDNHGQKRGLDLILIRDGQEALIGESLGSGQARASWTSSSALVSIVGHHLLQGGRRRFSASSDSHRQ